MPTRVSRRPGCGAGSRPDLSDPQRPGSALRESDPTQALPLNRSRLRRAVPPSSRPRRSPIAHSAVAGVCFVSFHEPPAPLHSERVITAMVTTLRHDVPIGSAPAARLPNTCDLAPMSCGRRNHGEIAHPQLQEQHSTAATVKRPVADRPQLCQSPLTGSNSPAIHVEAIRHAQAHGAEWTCGSYYNKPPQTASKSHSGDPATAVPALPVMPLHKTSRSLRTGGS